MKNDAEKSHKSVFALKKGTSKGKIELKVPNAGAVKAIKVKFHGK
jgi:hypothetical protein